MAWENRKGRGHYFTRSRRINGRVVREYVGVGPVGELMAKVDEIERTTRMLKRSEMRAEQAAFAELDEPLDELDQVCRQLVQAALDQAGYHQHHRGEWRKRREQKPAAPQ